MNRKLALRVAKALRECEDAIQEPGVGLEGVEYLEHVSWLLTVLEQASRLSQGPCYHGGPDHRPSCKALAAQVARVVSEIKTDYIPYEDKL